MPTRKPITVPRAIAHLLRVQSAMLGSTSRSLRLVFSAPAPFCSAPASTSPRPNRPIAAGRKSMPSIISMMPKPKRASPEMMSKPTIASIRPNTMLM